MGDLLACFKAYDVRGRMPDELNEDIAYSIGRAFAQFLKPKTVVVGYDIRLTSKQMCDKVIEGLRDAGSNVLNIGMCGTEEVYFATAHLKADGGICVTASHNPKDYNGMKFVREGSRPISGDTGLKDIEILAHANDFPAVDANERGSVEIVDTRPAYTQHLLTYVEADKLKPLKIVCNAGNGGGGLALDAIEPFLPIEWVKVHHEQDGNFPHGVPNPLLIENRASTIKAIADNKADLGIAWDGDFDRCFFFDDKGTFIEGYYIVGLLAEAALLKNPGASIVHDPRLTWNTIEMAEAAGGKAIQSKTGHAFIKERMRLEDAVYGGEMSAHHYFKDFFYCDSGMIPWLLVVELISKTGKSLTQLVEERMAKFPCSGEINSVLEDAPATLVKVEAHYASSGAEIDHTDGLSMNFGDWRFNLRASNTEPVVRLNVESRGDQALMEAKTAELLKLMKG
ncbi:Phosphomannomutase [Oleispira antarctica RB-8]|uniref:phosphomannomutase n=1 Tax=Oleispira antarctica RB-8 TaxID=698738 RepID=R4YUH9_OLEAN|nr:Phosphomannomutase [Oleispira antarctica RB-8]